MTKRRMDFMTVISLLQLSFLKTWAFPENLLPITTYDSVQARVFTGGDERTEQRLRGLQTVKTMDIAGVRRIAVASRENLYFLDPEQFSQDTDNKITFNEIYRWSSSESARDLCLKKGQPEDLCYNFLSVLEPTSMDQLLLCGTNSFNPLCANYEVKAVNNKLALSRIGETMSGKQRSPYGPNQPSVSTFTGGSFYSATFQSFFGGVPVISRTMGDNVPLRTTTTSTIMQGPQFVKMSEDEKRILIYFNEVQELGGGEKRIIAQVAQVCKNDVGGNRVLQRSFTTFLKSRLNCSYHGYFLDRVNDVTEPLTVDGQAVIFATFSTPENSLPGSAICSFKLDSIYTSMTGSFYISDDFTPSSGSTPPKSSRHPGLCPEDKLANEELVFLKSHPQMEKYVNGSLLLTNQGQRWTAISVDNTAGPDNVTMLFIGTDDGHLIRTLSPSPGWPRGVVISDENIFDENRCLTADKEVGDRRVLSVQMQGDVLLIAFKNCIVSVPLGTCARHTCKSSCLTSADPYCGWDGSNCVPFHQTGGNFESSLKSGFLQPLQPCPEIPEATDEALPEKETPTTSKTPQLPKSQADTNPEEGAGVKEEQVLDEKLASYSDILMVVIVTFISTALLMLIVFLIVYFRCLKRKNIDEEMFKKMQMEELHPDEKVGSLSQKARQTYYGMKDWLRKATTPVTTPQALKRGDLIRTHCQNNYSEAPTLQKMQQEQAIVRRSMSSRQNSTSSYTSRHDSITCNQTSQPLLTSACEICYPELTLTRSISEAATLPMPSKPTGGSPISSGESPVRSSGSSPFYPESGAGAAETGILPTASAKLRRRNERAANQTNEIMRESDTAIRELESTLMHMQEHGLVQPLPPPPTIPNRIIRQRLDSNDSGKGESPRNSLQNDLENPASVTSSRPQRPNSLNIQRPSVGGRRQRLLSEGCHPFESSSPVSMPPRYGRERHPSGQSLNRSQPTTPVNMERCPVSRPGNHQVSSELPIYSTLPKDNCPNDGHGRRHSYTRQHMAPPAQQFPKNQAQVFQVPDSQPFLQHPNNMYNQVKLQRRASECNRSMPGVQTTIPSSCVVSAPKTPINYYPSLQVRGAHAQKPLYHPQQQKWVNKAPPAPPKNYYPSLPHRSSMSPYNSYVSSTGFERPATLHKREKLPALMRQTSMPGSGRPGVFVPTPTVPGDGAA